MKVAKFIKPVILMLALMAGAHRFAFAQPAPSASSKHAFPQGWDSTIPLPPDAVLLGSTVPQKRGVYTADFSAKGTYPQLVDFYEKGLPKAGFTLGPKTGMATRKVYNLSFKRGGSLNNVVITPNLSDPTKFNLHFAWSPQTSVKKPGTH